MADDYVHRGMREPGTWGAMTAPVGARTDWWVQKAREAAAGTLNLLTLSHDWAAPKPERMLARERGR